jgi:D-alanyl-lipoteichoic acid acyltransferase DltB (MBOAT superfamily)
LLFILSIHPNLLIYIIAYSLINYYLGLKIPVSRHKKSLFRTGIILNLAQLILLKYSIFAIDPILRLFSYDLTVSSLSSIIVPVGISFFTLQGLGYLININMGWEKPEKNYSNFLLYIIFYPKFLSGPIERSNHFLPQLNTDKPFDKQGVIEGLRIALFGFFKKIVIANQLGLVVNNVYSDPEAFGGINLWITILIQPLYLYFDFSGYTDIARGLAKMYGIDLLPNFDKPFLSQNVTAFWKRFHISLSSWFNDYVFRQTSFKLRKWGIYASIFGVFVTFTLFGIWHGAGWNFMVLGFLQAMAINYEFFTKKSRTIFFSKIPGHYRLWSGRVFTYLFFGLSLIFFFSPDIGTVFSYFSGLTHLDFAVSRYIEAPFALAMCIFLVLLLLFVEVIQTDMMSLYRRIEVIWRQKKYLRLIVYYLAIFLMIFQLGGKVTFIYQMF